jgi:hypothetical protein
MMFKKTLLAAVLGLAIAAPAAQAAIQTWNFSGTVESGSLIGETYSGLFSFDDAGLTGTDSEYLTVSSLSMLFNSTAYTLVDELATTEVAFDNGNFLGMTFSADNFTFIHGWADTSDAYFAYDATFPALSGTGNVVYAPVPEPRDWMLMLAGLGLVGVMVERSRRRSL